MCCQVWSLRGREIEISVLESSAVCSLVCMRDYTVSSVYKTYTVYVETLLVFGKVVFEGWSACISPCLLRIGPANHVPHSSESSNHWLPYL